MAATNKTIYQKLAAVQAKTQTLHKSTEGYGYKYATLSDVLSMLQPLLAEEEIAVVHTVGNDDALGQVFITTLHDSSDQVVETRLPIPAASGGGKMNPMQQMGSITSYAKRYNLQLLFNLASSDDDAKGAEAAEYKKPAPKPAKQAKKKKIGTQAIEVNKVIDMLEGAKGPDELEAAAEYIKGTLSPEQQGFIRPLYKQAMERIAAQ